MLGTGSKRTDVINPQPKTKIKIKQIAPLKITNYVIVSPKPKNEAYEQAGGLQPKAEPYAGSDRIKTSAFRRRPLAPYVPLRFYPSESASEQAYGSAFGVPRYHPYFHLKITIPAIATPIPTTFRTSRGCFSTPNQPNSSMTYATINCATTIIITARAGPKSSMPLITV